MKLKKELNALIMDTNFQFLCDAKESINVFKIADINEIKNSNMLAWILNPNENHNCGDIFLKRLLFEIISKKSEPGTTNDNFNNAFEAIHLQNQTFLNAIKGDDKAY